MQVKTATARVGKAFNSVSRTSKIVRMIPIELFCLLTVYNIGLQRRRGNCFVPLLADSTRRCRLLLIEIPAFAGMVCLGTEDLWADLAAVFFINAFL